MTGTRDKSLDKKRDDQQERKNHAAEPERDRGPMCVENWLVRDVEEEEAGCYKHRARQQKSRTKNQRDAVLGALKANEGDSRKNKGKQASDNLEVALEGCVSA